MKIAVMPGDGIGPEVTAQALEVVRAVLGSGAALETVEAPIGQAGIDAAGVPLPPATLEIARKAEAILFGSVGAPGEEYLPVPERPGVGLLQLRRALGLFANFRPAFLFPELVHASTLKREVVEGLDLLILRELNGDLYYGEPRGIRELPEGGHEGVNTMRYTTAEIERIAHVAFRAARARRRKLCSVDKANVLETMQLWRETVNRVGRQYEDVELKHLFVDAAAMMLMRTPRDFDVMVMGNMFGDILSDAAAMLTGSLGMLPSASLADGRFGLYEPVHGTAPDIAGKDIANPLAAILSAAMMFRYSFGREQDAQRIERAVRRVLADGLRTADIMESGARRVGTEEMGAAVVRALAA